MNDLGLFLGEIWHWLNDAPEPGSPGQINRTVTAWAGRMKRAKVMLMEAQRAAIEMQGRLVEQSVQIARLRETIALQTQEGMQAQRKILQLQDRVVASEWHLRASGQPWEWGAVVEGVGAVYGVVGAVAGVAGSGLGIWKGDST